MTKIRFDPASIHMTLSLNSFGKLFAHAQRGKLKQTCRKTANLTEKERDVKPILREKEIEPR